MSLAAPSSALAAPEDVLNNPSAITHFKKAQKRFDEEDYRGAIPELKAAYAIEPNPMLLYAWAQAERLDGDCRRAIELYEKFLDKEPTKAQRQLAEANIVDCETALADAPQPALESDPQPALESDPQPASVGDEPPPDVEPGDRETPWHRDWVAGTLLGVGAASLIGGGVLLGVGKTEVDASAGASTEGAYFDAADAGQAKFTAGAVLASIGGALVVGGVVRLVVLGTKARKRSSATRAAVGVPWGSRGVTLGVRGRF